jgi:hypothetical protein
MDLPVRQRTVSGAPSVLRASMYFWLASALVSGIVPAIVMILRPPDPMMFAVSMWLLLLLIGLQCWAALRLLRGERWARFVLSAMAIMSVGGALGATEFFKLNGTNGS